MKKSNPFDTYRMARGYAKWRPPVHPHVVARIRGRLRIDMPVGRALDVGCGAGLSSAPLELLAEQTIGIDPSEAMVGQGRALASRACFAAGLAEELPIRSRSIDIVTAAGSLNWGTDLGRFFAEAARVLVPGGTLVIYDFAEGRDFEGSGALQEWFGEFHRRYPPPPALAIDPETLKPEPHGLTMSGSERFEVSLRLTPEFYLEYMLTETNVAAALGRGIREEEIRSWCEGTLPAVFQGHAREVMFRGYIAFFAPL